MPAGSEVTLAGTFQKIQCVISVELFAGAVSTSCRSRAKLCVPAGAPLQFSGKEAARGSTQEYRVGIVPPSAKAGVITLNFGGGGGDFRLANALANPAPTQRTTAAQLIIQRVFMISLPPLL